MAAAGGAGTGDGFSAKRGLPKKGPTPPSGGRVKGQPSNAIPLSQYTMEELRKMAASRGIPVEKLVAQLIAQYLAEDKG